MKFAEHLKEHLTVLIRRDRIEVIRTMVVAYQNKPRYLRMCKSARALAERRRENQT